MSVDVPTASRSTLAVRLLMAFMFALVCSTAAHAELADRVPFGSGDRIWLGPEVWANPMLDWRTEDGEIVAESGRNRTAHALGRRIVIDEASDGFELSVSLVMDPAVMRAGFRIGIQGRVDDPRSALVEHGVGLNAAIDTTGRLMLHKTSVDTSLNTIDGVVHLSLKATPKRGPGGRVTLLLSAKDQHERTAEIEATVDKALLEGNIALLAESGYDGLAGGDKRPRVRFRYWRIVGNGVTRDATGLFGPILWSQYTLADNRLRVSAQMPPLGPNDSSTVVLEVAEDPSASRWREVARGEIDPDARVAVMEVDEWSREVPTAARLRYVWQDESNYWPMTIRPEPGRDEPITIAGFSCDHGYAFPLTPMVEQVIAEDPDLVFFAGDQIYESYGGFGVLREGPVEESILDYLRKYYQFGWSWREVLAHRPSVIIPDDHDVFHGNIWGEAGRLLPAGERPVNGGYLMPVRFVNAVQRTQTAHLPAPHDPTPTVTGIGVYYTSFRYGPL
ncbi:MAG: hypothetical protein AAF593_17545, partial [Planctomycetota bacterium]